MLAPTISDDGAADDTDEAGQALALLALLAGQDVEWIDDGAGGGVWRIARKVAHDRVISTVDTETRHAHKSRSRKQDGFKANDVKLCCGPVEDENLRGGVVFDDLVVGVFDVGVADGDSPDHSWAGPESTLR
jgi:hypothetical protein